MPAAEKAATVRLPTPVPAQPQVELATPPEVEPIVAPPTPVTEPPIVRRAPARIARSHAADKAPVVEEAPKPVPPSAFEPWPVRIVDGAAGRLVRVGAFSSVHQAKRGWWAITKVNPALKRLPDRTGCRGSLTNRRAGLPGGAPIPCWRGARQRSC